MFGNWKLLVIVAAILLVSPVTAKDELRGHVTAVGGIFFKSENPKELMAWYREVLGLKVEAWGGAQFASEAANRPPYVTLYAVGPKDSLIGPSKQEFMINFAVDDLSAILERIERKGVRVLKRTDDDPYGRFAWIIDPNGTKIELWEPKR
jgi:predicted enzyme related to lactoylglutathione lyase